MHVIVIGAGIVGIACALHLRRRGLEVTVLDREPPGEACSFGNAGLLASASFIPIATPGLIRRVPKMLADPLGPVTIRWRHLPTLAPWLLRMLTSARHDRMEASVDALQTLVSTCLEEHETLAEGTPAEELIRRTGVIYLYRDEADAEAEALDWQMRYSRGVRLRALQDEALHEAEPAVGPDYRYGIETPEVAHVTDPSRYVKLLAENFVARGGGIVQVEVQQIDLSEPGAVRVAADGERFQSDRVVVAAGSWSGRLTEGLGFRMPLDTERGYHATIPEPGIELSRPLGLREAGIVITPMDMGLRVAGTDELATLDAPPDYRRAEVILERARRALPGLSTEGASVWMGQRPSFPDSLPVIGPVPDRPEILLACGHQHVGLTGAPVTGRWIADMITGVRPNVDLSAFAADRF